MGRVEEGKRVASWAATRDVTAYHRTSRTWKWELGRCVLLTCLSLVSARPLETVAQHAPSRAGLRVASDDRLLVARGPAHRPHHVSVRTSSLDERYAHLRGAYQVSDVQDDVSSVRRSDVRRYARVTIID